MREREDNVKCATGKKPLRNVFSPFGTLSLSTVGAVPVAAAAGRKGLGMAAVVAGTKNIAIGARGAAENALQNHP